MAKFISNKIFAFLATFLFSIFILGVSSCGSNTSNKESAVMSDKFPPKPSTYDEFHQVDEFFDSISEGNTLMHSRIMYNLTETDRKEYLDTQLDSDSVPFSETWIFQHWEDKAKYLYEDNESRWSNFEFSVSVIE